MRQIRLRVMSYYFILVDCGFRHKQVYVEPPIGHGQKVDDTPDVTPDIAPKIGKVLCVDAYHAIRNKHVKGITYIGETFFVWLKKAKFSAKLNPEDHIIYVLRNSSVISRNLRNGHIPLEPNDVSVYDVMSFVQEHTCTNRGFVVHFDEQSIECDRLYADYIGSRSRARQVPNIWLGEGIGQLEGVDKIAYIEYMRQGLIFLGEAIRSGINTYHEGEHIPKWDVGKPIISWTFNVETPFLRGVIYSTNLHIIPNVDDQPPSFLILESSGFRRRLYEAVSANILHCLYNSKLLVISSFKADDWEKQLNALNKL